MRITACLIVLATALASAQAPSRDVAAAAPVPTGSASLSGAVNDDASRPVRRALVSISGDMRVSFTTITDEQGKFSFTNLPAGRFTVTAKKPAYPSMSFGAKRPNRNGSGILLTEGQQVTGIALTLIRGAVLAGTVFDTSGQPMPGVPVMPWEVRMSLAGERTLDSPSTGGEWVTTDDLGRYRVFGLPAGEYTVGTAWSFSGSGGDVRVPTEAEIRAAFLAVIQPPPALGQSPTAAVARASTGIRYNYTPVFMPDSLDPLAASTVQVAAGEERTGLDLHMQFRPVSRVEVTVVGPDAPSRVEVSVARRSRVQALNTTTVSVTGPDGRYTSPSLGPGDYTVRASVRAAAGKPAMWAQSDVSITGADPVEITLRLQPAMTAAGQVAFDATTQTPPPGFAGVRVSLASFASAPGQGPDQAVVDPSGSFSIGGVTPGRFRVAANVPNPAAPASPVWTLRSVTWDGRDVTDVPIDVVPGAAPTFTVMLTDRIAELSGTLTDASGQPATDYFIIVVAADRQYWLAPSRRVASARPDVRGHFVFRGLPPGDYRIAATTDLVQRDLQDANALARLVEQSAPVSLTLGERKTFDIKIGGQ